MFIRQANEEEMLALIHIVKRDTGVGVIEKRIKKIGFIRRDYFSVPINEIRLEGHKKSAIEEIKKMFYLNNDTLVYLRCLAELHKRRKKYSKIYIMKLFLHMFFLVGPSNKESLVTNVKNAQRGNDIKPCKYITTKLFYNLINIHIFIYLNYFLVIS